MALKEINKENSPTVYLSHKARNDAVDDILAEELQNKGFFGEQVEFNSIRSDQLLDWWEWDGFRVHVKANRYNQVRIWKLKLKKENWLF